MKSIGVIIRMLIDAVFPKDTRHRRAISGIHTLSQLTNLRETEKGILYLFDYHTPLVQDMVVTLKTWGDGMVAEAFGKALNDILFDEIVEIKTFSSLPITVTCVPISKNKRLERGFNQCELIISEMKKISSDKDILFNNDCLKVLRETEDQIGKSKQERIENLKGAFVADESLVRDRNIFVLDDVVTTGATLLEARRALIEAGAKKVVMIAIAH